MNSKDQKNVSGIDQLSAAVLAFWVSADALINTFEHRKKSAIEKEKWIKKIEKRKIEDLISDFLSAREKQDKQDLEEAVDRHHDWLKKIWENSLEDITKKIPEEQNWENAQHIYELLQKIKKYEAEMMDLAQIIIELKEIRKDLVQKIAECDQELKMHREDIAVIDARMKKRDEEYDRIVKEILQPLYTGEIHHFDLSKLQSDDPWFMDIIRQGIAIIDFNHDNVIKELGASLSKNRPDDKNTIDKIVNELAKQIVFDLINTHYSSGLTREQERERFVMLLENCTYYKEEVAKISRKIIIELDQQKIQPLEENRVAQEPDRAQKSQKIIASQEVEVRKEKHISDVRNVDSECEEAENKFRKLADKKDKAEIESQEQAKKREASLIESQEQAKRREAALQRISQMKRAKMQSVQQPVSLLGSDAKNDASVPEEDRSRKLR